MNTERALGGYWVKFSFSLAVEFINVLIRLRKPSNCATMEKNSHFCKRIMHMALYHSSKTVFFFFFFSPPLTLMNLQYCLCYLGEESWTTRFTGQTETGRRAGAGHVFVISALHTKALTVACTNGPDKFKCHFKDTFICFNLETGEGWRINRTNLSIELLLVTGRFSCLKLACSICVCFCRHRRGLQLTFAFIIHLLTSSSRWCLQISCLL